MKEVLTKSFWRGVTKTFYEALEAPAPKGGASQAQSEKAAEAKPSSDAKPSSRDDSTRSKTP